MTDQVTATSASAPRRSWLRRLGKELLYLFLGLVGLAIIGLVLLDSAPGHRFLVDQIGKYETQSGLKFRISRIEGSIFGKATLRGVTVSDPKGVFVTSPEIRLDWAPGAWLYNSLHIDSLEASQVEILRRPELRPTVSDKPLLPGFDIHIGRLKIDRLLLAKGVAGDARTGTLEGSADIRAGRLKTDVQLGFARGDRLAARIDIEPKRNLFDVNIRAAAPADGIVPTLTGVGQPMDLVIGGSGSWEKWRGNLDLTINGRSSGKLALAADSGRYRVNGTLAPSVFLSGAAKRLTEPSIRVNGEATFKDRVLDGELALASPSVRAVARGALDFGENSYRQMRVGMDLLRPSALVPTLSGRDIRLVWTLDGPMKTADFSYRLTSPQMAIDNTGFIDVRAEGRGTLTPWPVRVPISLGARQVTGVGDVAGGILANISLNGTIEVTPSYVRGERLALRSDKVNGLVTLLFDIKTGRFDIALSGSLNRYLIPGIGVVDITTDLKFVPDPSGKGARMVGTATAQVRRLDNAFFASLTGGLPRITTNLERRSDGILRFTNLQLYSPKLRFSGQGIRRKDGTFLIEGRGQQADYGPVRVRLDGPIERPQVELFLQSPNKPMGLSGVKVYLTPTAAGYDYRAAGGSRLGPFSSRGAILLPKGASAIINVAALNVAGTNATGSLRSVPGGFDGLLTLNGGGLGGTLAFRPVDGVQQIETHLTADHFAAVGPPAIAMRTGRIDGIIILKPGATTISGTINGRGVVAGGTTLTQLSANANLVNGSGKVSVAMTGTRGNSFDLKLAADVTPERISITGGGGVGGQPLTLDSPAVLTAVPGGWKLAPTRVKFGGGLITASGRTGDRPVLNANIQSMPLQLLDIFMPNARLGGTASGQVEYQWSGAPSGKLSLRVRNLSRAGLVLASKPIDVGINAVLENGTAAMRAVAVSDGKTIGRMQGRFAPLGSGPIMTEIMNAPMQVQMRYAGPADTLWRLSNVELFDLSGPVAIAADIGGRMVDPQIRGSVRTQNARLESAITGTVIEQLNSYGRFEGSRLIFSQLQGTTPGNGSISGTGTVEFSGGAPAINLSFDAQKAKLLGRDDISASVTGPIAVRSSGTGGTISGQLRLDSGTFTLGQASNVASVPQLQVRNVGGEVETDIDVAQLDPWRLNVKVKGGPLTVRGLGIDSRWTTDVDIGGVATAPQLTGTANLVRGDYDFAGRNFRLTHGVIRFHGESPVNPSLDIRAEAQVQGLDASVLVKGTGLLPEITFASVPPLPQDELLSRILFGTSITNLSAPEALQLAAAVTSLRSGGGGLDPINAVRRAVGLDRLRIIPADIATGQKTAISAGKYIGRRMFVEVITDGQGYSATQIEYQVTRWLSILSSVSTIGRASTNVRISKDY